MKLASFGEILWDVYPDEKFIGGAALNFAAHFSKCGGKAYMISAVGKDNLANETIECVEKMSVSTKYISRSDKETGKCLVTLNEKMIPTYDLLSDVAYDYIDTSAITGKTFDLLYFGSLALRSEYNMKNLEKLLSNNSFAEIVVDINIRPPYYSDDVIKYALEKASIIKISDEELNKFTKEEWLEKIELLGYGKYNTEKVPFGYDYSESKDECLSVNKNHGYHVAGIIAANRSSKTPGIASGAQIYSENGINNSISYWLAAITNMIVNQNIKVINISMGYNSYIPISASLGCEFSQEFIKKENMYIQRNMTPPVVKNLIIANCVALLATTLLPFGDDIIARFALFNIERHAV